MKTPQPKNKGERLKPITIEECAANLESALRRGDTEEIKKWDFLIRSESEFRIRNKQRARQVYEQNLSRKFRESYRLPPHATRRTKELTTNDNGDH